MAYLGVILGVEQGLVWESPASTLKEKFPQDNA